MGGVAGTLLQAALPDMRARCDHCRINPTANVLKRCRHFLCDPCLQAVDYKYCPIVQCLFMLEGRRCNVHMFN